MTQGSPMVIRSHAVPILPSGLSPMQERLLRSEKHVSLVSAPTGAGKSYAFMRAVLDEGAHVLFIVPTKRLLQNLIEDARELARDGLGERGLDDARINAWIDERLIEWSGNQPSDERERLPTTRVRQFLDGGLDSGGGVIFAVPEVVVGMISGIAATGASAVNPFLFLRRFDHIVFDEFHTIDDRSFGLACLLSMLAIAERRGKVSLLSATPIDVTRVLDRVGIGQDDMETIAEQVVDGHPAGHRPIHGNVTVSVRPCSLPESFARSIDIVRATIAAGRTVIVIYDSLQRLKQDEPSIRLTLAAGGVADAKVLPIDSIDDSERKPGEPRRGRRYQDPRDYDVLLCTSSVEIGVTFRSTLMFTEPGHGLASFVQRVGQVSRGANDGQVIVSLPERRRNRSAWTRRVASVVHDHDEVDVETFIREMLRDVRRRLEPPRKEAEADSASNGANIPFFRRASWRGLYWAALFIVAVRRKKMTVQRQANARLRAIAPGVVRFVDGKIGEILSVDVVNDNLRRQSQPHRRWVDALLESAITYRDIGATIVVADPNGSRHTVSESFLRRATDILQRHIATDVDGERVIHLMSHTLDEEIRSFPGNRDAQRLMLYVPSPIEEGSFSLSIRERDKGSEQLYVRLVEEWRHRFGRFIPSPGDDAIDPRKKVMGAATALIEKLGRPPLDEDYEDSSQSALFA